MSIEFNFKKDKTYIQYNLNGSNTDGSFTVDDLNFFFSPYKILPIAQENKYLMIYFLFYHGIVCCAYSLELPHQGILRVHSKYNHCVENQKAFPKLSLCASWTGAVITLSGSNYPCLERISMVPKMFEPLGFDCILFSFLCMCPLLSKPFPFRYSHSKLAKVWSVLLMNTHARTHMQK